MNVIELIERGEFELTEYVPSLQEHLASVEAKKAEKELLCLARHGQAMDWIPVSEGLPEIGRTVLVIDKHETIRTVYLSTEYWIGAWTGEECSFCKSTFTHWMPLPPAPEVKP